MKKIVEEFTVNLSGGTIRKMIRTQKNVHFLLARLKSEVASLWASKRNDKAIYRTAIIKIHGSYPFVFDYQKYGF